MKKLKSLLTVLVILVLATAIVGGCGSTPAENNQQTGTGDENKSIVLKVGATPVPHAELLAEVKDDLAAEGITLEIVNYQDYVQPNLNLADGEIDANFFQHIQYLEGFNKDHNLDLVNAGGIHIEPMGIYSNVISDLKDVKEKAKVAIPNDATNGGRSLLLLEKAGLITIGEVEGDITPRSIKENPHNLEIIEVEAAMLPKIVDDVQFAVINTNYALDAGFNPMKDALFMEDSDSPYVNIITTRKGDENSPAIKKLIEALTSEDIRNFIIEKYEGAVVPAF
ncbi:MAG: MetQ/NlpA family ABC transporter substrate-binding protein [Peptococcia bacterium]